MSTPIAKTIKMLLLLMILIAFYGKNLSIAEVTDKTDNIPCDNSIKESIKEIAGDNIVKYPTCIRQAIWLNNNEILIADGDYYPGMTRILKYNVSLRKFILFYNGRFGKNFSLGFSRDGKTIVIFDNITKVVSVIRNNILIHTERDFADEFYETAGSKYERDLSYNIENIIVTDNYAIIRFSVVLWGAGSGVVVHRDFLIDYASSGNIPYGNFKKELENYKQLFNIRNGGRIYFEFISIYYCNRLFVYSTEQNLFKEIMIALPERDFNYPEQIRSCNEQMGILGAVIDKERSEHYSNYYRVMLCIYDLKSENCRFMKQDVQNFDISKDFIVTAHLNLKENEKCSKVIKYHGKIEVFNSKYQRILERDAGTFDCNIQLFPMISPDQSHIVVFICGAEREPIVMVRRDKSRF